MEYFRGNKGKREKERNEIDKAKREMEKMKLFS